MSCSPRVSRCHPEMARWGDASRSQGRGERPRRGGREDGGRSVIGRSRAAAAGSRPSGAGGRTRQGEAPTCRSPAQPGAHDRGPLTEEPGAGKRSRTVLLRRAKSRVEGNMTGRLVTFPETLFSLLPRNRVTDPAYAASQ